MTEEAHRRGAGRRGSRRLVPAWLFLGLAALALAGRLARVPWDTGGCFFQLCMTALGLLYFARLYPRLEGPARWVALVCQLPLGAFVLLGSWYFAPQALLPFPAAGVVLAGVLHLWSRSRRLAALLVTVPLTGVVAVGVLNVPHMAQVLRVRSLSPQDTAEIRLVQVAHQTRFQVVDPEAVRGVVRSLRQTSPYSPSHEGIQQPWLMTLVMRDGSEVELRIGKGNRAHPGFAWVEVGPGVYQNAGLPQALREAHADPWDAAGEEAGPGEQDE